MTDEQRVSVVVTCYNYRDYLTRALESVASQDYQNWEMVIVDDGSTDDSFAIARGFQRAGSNHRVTLISTANGGASRARNVGISVARGDLILCLDADDWLTSDALGAMVAVLDSKPDVSVVRSDIQEFGISNKLVDVPEYNFDLITNSCIAAVSSMFRRGVWEEVGGFDESLIGYEDWNYWIDVGKRGHMMDKVHRPLLNYRSSSDGRLARALPRDLELRAEIIVRHPDVYDSAVQSVAKRILAGDHVTQEELENSHPIFSWKRAGRARKYR